MSEKHVLVLLTLVFMGLLFLRPQSGFSLRSFFDGSSPPAEDLAAEVAVLRAEVDRERLLREQLATSTWRGVPAEVYSEYPFGLKHELLVNLGEEEGARVGQPALFRKMFVGRITKVFPHTSVIETLFDVRAKYPVRVGAQGVNALLVGGGEPHLTLIANDAKVEEKGSVYTASPTLPYGLNVGVVGTLHVSRDGLFKEAAVQFPYNIGEIRVLDVLISYVPL